MVDDFLTLDEAAEHLNVHRATIGRRIAQGHLIAYKAVDGRKRYVKRSDLDRLRRLRPVPRVLESPTATPATAA